MKKKIVTSVIIYILWLLVLYTAIAFYHNTFNHHDWSVEGRLIFALFGIFAGAVIDGVITGLIISENKE